MTSRESPFDEIRFEQGGHHIYYLPRHLRRLESTTSTYLIGSRGSGKTTLLKAMSWNERSANPSLRAQLPRDPFAKRYIGLYFKLPHVQLALLDRWLAGEPVDVYAGIFSLYLDLVWLELAAQAVVGLQRDNFMEPVTREGKAGLVAGLTELYGPFALTAGLIHRNSVDSYASSLGSFRLLRLSLDRMAKTGVPPDVVLSELPYEAPGTFGRRVGRMISDHAPSNTEPWWFRVCMDEGEALSESQQRVLNTMVRLGEWPVTMVVAYVRPPSDVTTTVWSDGYSLQAADRQVIVHDEMSDSEFKELALGVLNVRLRVALSDPDYQVDLRRCLGRLDLNELLATMLRGSENPAARALLQRAEAVNRRKSGPKPASPPIYQTYLREAVAVRAEPPTQDRAELRRYQSTETRKRMVAAYLSLAREYSREGPMFASPEMLFQMSDNCIRDFLLQLKHLHEASGGDIADFLAKPLNLTRQNNGFKRAARAKVVRLTDRILTAPVQAQRVVEGLAMLTARLQQDGGPKQRHLRQPERGIFIIELRGLEPRMADQVRAILQDAAETGYLRIIDSESHEVRCRVHASLAPAFGFSYRGAYYTVRLLAPEVDMLRLSSEIEDVEGVVAAISDRLNGERADAGSTLF